MYIPSTFKEVDENKLYDFIQTYPLGTLITSAKPTIDADHIPFYLQTGENQQVTLQSHIAKTNPLWKHCDDGQEILLIFHGPNAFVSPNFYPSKKATGKVVPTWNYSVVHVRGYLYFKHDTSWIWQQIKRISDFHELSQRTPWSVSDAPERFIEKLVKAVVGLEVVIEDIVGNFKLSQDKTDADYSGVVNGLANTPTHSAKAVAEDMRKSRKR